MPALNTDPGHIPGPVFIPSCAAVRLWWQLPNGKRAFNVLHGRYASPPIVTQAALNSFFTSIRALFTSSGLDDVLDVNTHLTNVGIRDMAQDTTGGSGGVPAGFSEVVSSNAGIAGAAVGGQPMPPQVALVVTLHTGNSGQANRGRVYLPGFNSIANGAGGAITDGARDAAQAFISGLDTLMDGIGLNICIAHPARQAYPGRGDPPVQHPARTAHTVLVTGILTLNNVWDTQRMRARV